MYSTPVPSPNNLPYRELLPSWLDSHLRHKDDFPHFQIVPEDTFMVSSQLSRKLKGRDICDAWDSKVMGHDDDNNSNDKTVKFQALVTLAERLRSGDQTFMTLKAATTSDLLIE